MKPFAKMVGRVAPLMRSNVDTDQIIPKQYLKAIGRTGFGDNLFDGWRYLDEGAPGMTQNERRINHEFVLNQPRYQAAGVLLAGENFGCGSSREHAVWALEEYGFRCVIAPSFADIFYNNCFKNGVLPIVLDTAVVDRLFAEVASRADYALTIDLEQQEVVTPAGEQLVFAIDAFRKHCLLNGLDDIGLTLADSASIATYEAERLRRKPWLFLDPNKNL